MANAKRRTPRTPKQHNSRRRLGENQKPIQQALETIYPIKNHKKEEKNQTPIWAKKAKRWSTKEEWERTQQHLEERNQIQKQLTKMDQTIHKQQQKIMLIKMISAWKQATAFLINNKKSIKYAETPEITPLEINKYKQNKRKQLNTYIDKITITGKQHHLDMERIIEIEYTEQAKKSNQPFATPPEGEKQA